jgi:acetyl-CoA carboxylase biotin carboxyl carrier protein
MEYEKIEKMMADMNKYKIKNLDIEMPDGTKVRLEKDVALCKSANESFVATESFESNQNLKEVADDFEIVKSPMVGVFYQSSSPEEAPFVKAGDVVKKGDTLCIIEAMKLMNELVADENYEIVEVLVKNEQIVEYGTDLFKVKKV